MNPSTMPPDTFVETLERIQKLVTDVIKNISTALNSAERTHNRAALSTSLQTKAFMEEGGHSAPSNSRS